MTNDEVDVNQVLMEGRGDPLNAQINQAVALMVAFKEKGTIVKIPLQRDLYTAFVRREVEYYSRIVDGEIHLCVVDAGELPPDAYRPEIN